MVFVLTPRESCSKASYDTDGHVHSTWGGGGLGSQGTPVPVKETLVVGLDSKYDDADRYTHFIIFQISNLTFIAGVNAAYSTSTCNCAVPGRNTVPYGPYLRRFGFRRDPSQAAFRASGGHDTDQQYPTVSYSHLLPSM